MDTLISLVTRAQAGDLHAYGAIVRRFQDMALGYAYTVLGDFHLAEDAAQEAFVEAYTGLPKLRLPAAFPSWFRKTVYKHCDRLTRGRRIQTVPLEEAALVASGQAGPDEVAEAREMQDRVLDALRALPEPEREVTALFYINGYSQAEIGAFLEVPVNTVKNRLRSARSHLKEGMVGMVEESLHQQRPSRDQDFADEVMDNLIRLTDREIQIILKEATLDLRKLAVAFKDAPRTLKDRLVVNMSDGARQRIEEEMTYAERTDQANVETFQSAVVEAIERLQDSGKIEWPPTGEPQKSSPRRRPTPETLAALREVKEKVRDVPVCQLSFDEVTEVMVKLAECCRRDGILYAYGEMRGAVDDVVLRQGLQLSEDGYDTDRVREFLESQVETLLHHQEIRCRVMVEGLLAIHKRRHPREVDQKLRTYFLPNTGGREAYTREAAGDPEAVLRDTPVSQLSLEALSSLLTDIAIVARSEAISELERIVELVDDADLALGLRMAIDYAGREGLREILERRMQTRLQDYETKYRMVVEGVRTIQCGEPPRLIEQKVRSFYE